MNSDIFSFDILAVGMLAFGIETDLGPKKFLRFSTICSEKMVFLA
jgi:hypothetical protein